MHQYTLQHKTVKVTKRSTLYYSKALKNKTHKNTTQNNIAKHEITLHSKITSNYKSTYITHTLPNSMSKHNIT